jgi:hypothetical protein
MRSPRQTKTQNIHPPAALSEQRSLRPFQTSWPGSGGLLDDIEHPNRQKYPGQRVLVVLANAYVYAVPYVPTPDGIFLKTAFPSRRLKAQYLPSESDEQDA